ncbi:MAG: aldo/keto reductase [Salibacter sp.]|uniref:aldo/keto reductase n=1 Tax=Salibacter sp. TaxID=2010995 RepID=UPI002870111A|nr:aldo/keto reductase [Salibacter sp.]MDR9399226.1 aldo/keto reductase [Salibacter sp.]
MKYKLFGNTGLRVSELCLGTMTFGTEWGTGADKDTSKKIFDIYAKAGGNFLDTANFYTNGTSEHFLGDFIKNDRDHFVLATKYSLHDREGDPNFTGNHRKNLVRSVNESLKRLQTDYIDILWLHMWDFTTSVEEVMRGLNNLVEQGKVLYIAISDTPAWIVAKANMVARQHGWIEFSGLQTEYSLVERTSERDLLPMAEDFGLSVTTWSPLGAGLLTGKYLNSMDGRLSEKSVKMTDHNLGIAKTVKSVADEIGASPSQVALQWLRQQNKSIIPIVGARKIEQIEDNLGCLNISLSNDQMNKLNDCSKVDLGFPHEFLKKDATRSHLYGGTDSLIEW